MAKNILQPPNCNSELEPRMLSLAADMWGTPHWPSTVEEHSRDVDMIEIFSQGLPNLPAARTTGNLSKAKTRFALILAAMLLGLTVYAELGVGAQLDVASGASKSAVATARNPEQGGVSPAVPEQEGQGLSPKA